MVTGSCLCGGVRFEINGRLTPMQYCHATRCQKATGSAFAVEVAARVEDFRWTRGEDLVVVYEAPLLREPPAYRRVFCRRCGSPLPIVRDESPFVVLHAGLLDDDPGTRPLRHLFVGQKPGWSDIHDDLLQFDGRPPPEQRLPMTRKDR
jgi:hypothetical protein